MEAVPRMPMLSFELKQSLEFVEFGPTLKQYIREHYGEDPAVYNKACTELDQLRQTAVHVSHDFMGCSTLKKYYSQLQFLQGRFPLGEMGEASIPFTWEDVHSGREVTRADIRFEQACILYNIGGLHSILGAMDTRQSADGMKVSCTHFQCAAWAFEHLRDHFECDAMLSEDLASEMLSFQVYLMLAQAQECILEKSMADSRKSTITAKVSAQIVEFYRTALKDLEKANQHDLLSSKRYKDWKKKIEIKILFYTCITNFYMGSQSEEQQKWGTCLAYFTLAQEKLTECQKAAKGESSDVQESLRFTNDVVGGKYQAAKKDNDFVYHDKIPAADTLPEVKGASLVKGIPFNPNDPEVSGPDIFQKLVPMEAHEASSLYSEEKANLLRRMTSEINEKNDTLNKYLASLQLDPSKLNPEPERLPQQLLEKCAALSVRQNAIKDLVDSMAAVSSVSTDVDMGIQEIQQLLQDESKAELEFQEQFGKRATNVILSEIAQECSRFEEGHKKGSQSNTDLHKAMNTHITNLKLLSSPLDELQNALPSVDKERDPESGEITKQLTLLLSKIEEMRSQRESLEEQFRKSVLEDDITGALCKQEGVNKEALFAEQLKKHDQTVSYIKQNLGAQDNILRALTDANAKYASIRMATSETVQRREQMIRDLINSYDVYEELMAKSQRGLEFYKKLETNVGRLLARCKAVCKVQQEEREQMYNRMKPKAPAPSRPIVSKPSPQNITSDSPSSPRDGGSVSMDGASVPVGGASLPVGGVSVPPSVQPHQTGSGMFDGPKLKDYLPFMKPKTFGKKDGSPPISSADPLVQDYMAQHSSLPPSGSASPVHVPQMSGSVPASPDHFRHRMNARLPESHFVSQPGQQVGPDLTQGHPQLQQRMSQRSRDEGQLRGQQSSPDPRLASGYIPHSQQQQISQHRGQGQMPQHLNMPQDGQNALQSSVTRGQRQVTQRSAQGDGYVPNQSQYVPLDQKWKHDGQTIPNQPTQQPPTQGQIHYPQPLNQSSQQAGFPKSQDHQVQSQFQGQFQGHQPGVQGQGPMDATGSGINASIPVQQVPMSQPGQYYQQQDGMGFQPQDLQQGPQPHSHRHAMPHPLPASGQTQPQPGRQTVNRGVTNTVTAVETPVISPGDEAASQGVSIGGYSQHQGQMVAGQGHIVPGQGQLVMGQDGYQPQGVQQGMATPTIQQHGQQSFPQQQTFQQPGQSQSQMQPLPQPQQPIGQGQQPVHQLGPQQGQVGLGQQPSIIHQSQQIPMSHSLSQPLPAKPQAYMPASSQSVPVGQPQQLPPQPIQGVQHGMPPPGQQMTQSTQHGAHQQSQQFPQGFQSSSQQFPQQVQPVPSPQPVQMQQQQPIGSQQQPAYSQQQAMLSQQPGYPQQQSFDIQQQTLPSQQQSVHSQQLPVHSQQQPIYSQQQLIPPQQQQIQSQQQPVYSQKQPITPQQQQPAYSQIQSVHQQQPQQHYPGQPGLHHSNVPSSQSPQHQAQQPVIHQQPPHQQQSQQPPGGQFQPHGQQGQIRLQSQTQPGNVQPHVPQQPMVPQQGQGQMFQAQPQLQAQHQQYPRHSSPVQSQYPTPAGQTGPRFTTPLSGPSQLPASQFVPAAVVPQGQGPLQGQVSSFPNQITSVQNVVRPQANITPGSQPGFHGQYSVGQGLGQQQQQTFGPGMGVQSPPVPSYAETDKNRHVTQMIGQGQGMQMGQHTQGQAPNAMQPQQSALMPQNLQQPSGSTNISTAATNGGQGIYPSQGQFQVKGQGQQLPQQMYTPDTIGQDSILQPQVLKPTVSVPTVAGQTPGPENQTPSQKQTQPAQNFQQGATTTQNYQQGPTTQNYQQGPTTTQNYQQGPTTTQNYPQGPTTAQNYQQESAMQTYPVQTPNFEQVPTSTQDLDHIPKEAITVTPQTIQAITGKDVVSAPKPRTPDVHTSRQISQPPGPSTPIKQISLDRQLSTASSLDEILSSSPDAKVEKTDSVLAPKVLTAQEIQHQKEDQLKNSSLKLQPKDPYKDRSKLDKFVREVEKLAKFVEGFEKPTCSGPTPLDFVWKEVMEEQDKAGRQQKLAIARCYPMKNRDQDIMPYDESRVLIASLSDDYINASWVNDLSPTCPKFIATQAPLPVTVVDFWLMVYEQGVEVLVALSSEAETGKKFPQHLPSNKGETVHHGSVQLTLQSVKVKNFWTERIMLLRHSETKTGRTLVHLHYNAWPISGFPEKVSHLLQFITEVHSFYRQQRSLMKPIVVHCSNGIGRTGMFLLIYVGMQEVNRGYGVINFPEVVGTMLWRRRNLILKKDQLKFCYEAILYFAQDVLAKEGILVHKASFGDQLPKPGVKSQSWEPGEDILFGSMSFTNLQTNVAKLGSRLDPNKLDQKLEALKNGGNLESVQTEISELEKLEPETEISEPKVNETPLIQTVGDGCSSLPDVVQSPGISKETKKCDTESSKSDMDVLSNLENQSQPVEGQGQNYDLLSDLDKMMRMKIETKGAASSFGSLGSDKSKTGSKPGSLTGSPAHVSRASSSSPQTQKKLENVASSLVELQDPNTFTIGTSSGTKKKTTKAEFTGERPAPQFDPNDPLSSLDPLWSNK